MIVPLPYSVNFGQAGTVPGLYTVMPLAVRVMSSAGGYSRLYAYVETTYYGQTVRGFVPLDCVLDPGY